MAIDRRRFLAGCALAPLLSAPAKAGPAKDVGDGVEIRRDSFGVPYIIGPTDAACAFGLGYAQAEDGFDYIEDNYLRAVGRAAEVHGADALSDDVLVRALEIPRQSREEYARSPAHMRAIFESFVAGLERFARDAGKRMQHFDRLEPWFPLALLRYKYHAKEFVDYAGLTGEDRERAFERPQGSNAWAIGPSKSAGGHAMLLINPHVGFFGPARYYECTMLSGEGWRFQGITRSGLPILYMGHNDHLGWAHTDNYPDFCDLFAETVRSGAAGGEYLYGGQWRPLREWTETISVRLPGGTTTSRTERFAATINGPIVGMRDGKPLSIRLAKMAEGGWMEQQHAMCRARNLAEFKDAIGRCDVPYMNIVYADRAGNILHVYAGAVPRRSTDFDWTKPVDGSDPRTTWQGYHKLDELPQTLNPPSGYVQNCNSTPFTAAGEGSDRRADYPRYMIGQEDDNLRARQSRRVLERTQRFDFESWSIAATDSEIFPAHIEIPKLLEAWSKRGSPGRWKPLAPLIAELQAWDGVSRIDSVAMTVFAHWFGATQQSLAKTGKSSPLDQLEGVRRDLIDKFGRWSVPWGEINRLQRIHWRDDGFRDDRPSLAVRGAPGWAGVVFNFYSGPTKGLRPYYGNLGNSYVATVEFAPVPRARSILVFGQAMEPGPHYEDQSALYADGQFKPCWWSPADIATRTRSARILTCLSASRLSAAPSRPRPPRRCAGCRATNAGCPWR